jgi:hypothetical protein
MSQAADAHHTTTMTVDSLAAAFQHFNITHVTALEFFQFVAQAEPAATKGAVIPICMSQPFQPIMSLIFIPDDRPLSQADISEVTKNIRTPSPPREGPNSVDLETHRLILEKFWARPVLPFWVDDDIRSEFMKQQKEWMAGRTQRNGSITRDAKM